ncbi:MAG: hypothetical protein K9K67_02870 [Bacteriovoracaceae bacterium]|nr:hypothetical protein [Bacteriovoracaceae bacterium]
MLKKPKSIFLFFLLVLSTTKATVFVETSIEDRLEQASGVIRGSFIGKSYKKLPSGRVVTEATFKLTDVSGIGPNEIVNHNNFKVLYPGGVWQNRIHKIHGSPEFKMNEEVILVIKKDRFGYIMPDLSLSKYNVIQEDGKSYVKSAIFSEKKGIGKMAFSEFEILLQNIYGSPLHKLTVDKYIDKGRVRDANGNERTPASIKRVKETEDDDIPVIWFVLGLGLMGFLPTLFFRGKRNES